MGDTGCVEEISDQTEIMQKEKQLDESNLRIGNTELFNLLEQNTVEMSEPQMRLSEKGYRQVEEEGLTIGEPVVSKSQIEEESKEDVEPTEPIEDGFKPPKEMEAKVLDAESTGSESSLKI